MNPLSSAKAATETILMSPTMARTTGQEFTSTNKHLSVQKSMKVTKPKHRENVAETNGKKENRVRHLEHNLQLPRHGSSKANQSLITRDVQFPSSRNRRQDQ
jgi:hypothetical protein